MSRGVIFYVCPVHNEVLWETDRTTLWSKLHDRIVHGFTFEIVEYLPTGMDDAISFSRRATQWDEMLGLRGLKI